jgi:hypothetical protein
VWLHVQKKIETRDIQGSKYLKQHKFWKKMSFGYNPYKRHTICYRKEGSGLFSNQCHVNLRQVCDLKMVPFSTIDLHCLTCACDLSTRWSWMYHVLLIPILELPHAPLSLLRGVRECIPKFFLITFIFFLLVPFGVHFQSLGKNLGVCHNNKVFKHGI